MMQRVYNAEAELLQDEIEQITSQALWFSSAQPENDFGLNADSTQEDIADAIFDFADAVVSVDEDVKPYEFLKGCNLFEVHFNGVRYPQMDVRDCTAIYQWRPDSGAFYMVCCQYRDSSHHKDVFMTDLVNVVLGTLDRGLLDSVALLQTSLLAIALSTEYGDCLEEV